MRTVTFLQVPHLTVGPNCLQDCLAYVESRGLRHVHLVTSPALAKTAGEIVSELAGKGITATVDDCAAVEPTVTMFNEALQRARQHPVDCIFGLGGGSALDLAKLLAAFLHGSQRVEETFGIGLLTGRACHLICVPTTAGTGSEVSPNAILLEEASKLKKGVVSPFLVPDATFIDPVLTVTVPPAVTAFTGLDTLTHCVEAYTNKFAHPLVDVYALRGIAVCAEHLVRAVEHGDDLDAREGMSLASLYGGLCLGPVNTAAVHALAYPLGGEFHVPHGLSNAILLPAVFRFNAEASPERHAEVAKALAVTPRETPLATALAGADRLAELVAGCGVRFRAADFGIGPAHVPGMAAAALTVTRLLKNNPRELTQEAAEAIYRASLW